MAYKEAGKYVSFKGKNKSTDIALEKDLMAEVLDKDFRTPVLEMLKQLKEDAEKVEKIRCEMEITIKKEKT